MRKYLTVAILLLAVFAPELLLAQGRRTDQSPGAGRGQRPPRDSARAGEPAATGSISGRVVTADSGRAVKRARVVIYIAGDRPRTATTDETGRYQLTALPAGTYTITAAKTGFVDAAFGQRRALRQGTPIQLADGQQLANVNLALARGAVIAGRVLDEDGEPLARAMVQVLRSQYQRGEKRLVAAGGDQSDDRGQYRIFGLPPGEYVVSATAGGLVGPMRRMMVNPVPIAIGVDDTAESTGYAPTYYPGVITTAEAARVKVAAAQELGGIDFQLQLVPLATVRGTTTDPRGMVSLVPEDGAGPFRMQNLRDTVGQDGTFSISNVPPGRYMAVARADGATGPATTAMQAVTVAGEDITISLAPVKGSRLGGTITFESSATPPPKSPAGLFRVAAQPLGSVVVFPPTNRAVDVDDAGRFTLADLMPGQYIIQATGLRAWTMKSVYLDGRDVTDQPIEIKGGDIADGLNIIFTDRISGLSGTVRASGDTLAAGTTVIAFASDEKLWRPQTRRIQTTRADQNGAYRIGSLPPGDYLVFVTDDVEQGEWFDPAYLESVREKALRVTIAEGEQKIQDLKAS